MLKSNKLLLTFAAATMAAGSWSVYAGSVTSTATVTVQNVIAIVENTPLSFGIISARAPKTADDGTAAKLVIPADGSSPTTSDAVIGTGGTAGVIIKISDGTPAEYGISGAPPFTKINVTVPTSSETLSNAAAPSDNGKFTIDTFTLYDVTGTADVTLTSGVGEVVTDSAGAVVFNVGATLNNTVTADEEYVDGEYSGTFAVTVAY